MGSTHTWLVGPWEPRLKCLVGNCCLPTYAAIHRTHILHCFPNFIPGWFQYGDTPDIAGLIAPRALHLNFGEKDDGSPIEEVREGIKTIARAYEQAGAADRFSYYIEAGRRPRSVRRDVAPCPRVVPETPVISQPLTEARHRLCHPEAKPKDLAIECEVSLARRRDPSLRFELALSVAEGMTSGAHASIRIHAT